MDCTLEDNLIRSFPVVFENSQVRDYPGSPGVRYFGCSCGEGWYIILRQLCATISRHIGEVERVTGEKLPFKFLQIKEKFGHLRVYFEGGDTFIKGALEMAEAMSVYTCDVTGEPGVLCRKPNGWLQTLCPAEAEKIGAVPYAATSAPKPAAAPLAVFETLDADLGIMDEKNMDRKINEYRLVCTCSICPEQYDVYVGEEQVGYLRLRHGHFRADYPDVGGTTVYSADTVGDGCFDSDDERDTQLTAAIAALDAHRKELLRDLPKT